MTITPEQLTAWRELAEKATPGKANGTASDRFLRAAREFVPQLLAEVERLREEDTKMLTETCGWQEEDNGPWRTSCGRECSDEDGEGPLTVGLKFCPWCGKPIAELPLAEDGDEQYYDPPLGSFRTY